MPVYAVLQVYYFSRGKVKPANRNFSTVRNDYTINLDNGCALPDLVDRPAFAALSSTENVGGGCQGAPPQATKHTNFAIPGKARCTASHLLRLK